jgi:hypothetical protein
MHKTLQFPVLLEDYATINHQSTANAEAKKQPPAKPLRRR